MRELWPLDIGWTYTILGGLRRSEEISLRHSDLSFPATVAPMEDSHRLVLEKQLHVKEEWAGKSFILQVNGANQSLTVSVNGITVGTAGLYDTNWLDVTYAMEIGTTNHLSVTLPLEGDLPLMVSGFDLLVTEPCHLVPNGISYMTEWKKDEGYTFFVDTEIQNHTADSLHYRLTHTLLDEAGEKVAKTTYTVHIPPFSTVKERKSVALPEVMCWSEKSPIVYTVLTELHSKTELIDQATIPCGIRPLRVDARRGVLQGNTPLKLRGIRDVPVLQMRMSPISLLLGEAQALLDSGINVVALTYDHNTEQRLSIFDQIGISAIVVLPVKNLYQSGFSKFVSAVKRLRNHPSLALWSIGELPFAQRDLRSILQVERIAHLIKAEDAAHPLTGEVEPTTPEGIIKNLQILTVKGDIHQGEAMRSAYSQKPILLQTAEEKAFLPAFHSIGRSYYVGHLQEVSAQLSGETPCESGILRLSMFAPRLMAQMQACYQTKFDVLDLQLGEVEEELQSLTLLTNCENTSLWVDGRPYGGTVKTQSPDRTVQIPLDFGYAEAVGFRDSKEVVRVQIEPVGNPYALALSVAYAPEEQKAGDVIWMNCTVLDSEGRAVPGVSEEVSVTLRGGACFDANPDHPKGEGLPLRLQNGHLAVALRRTEPRNPISLEVFSDRYIPASMLLK